MSRIRIRRQTRGWLRFLACAALAALPGLRLALADTITVSAVGDSYIQQLHPDCNACGPPSGSTAVIAGTIGPSGGSEVRRALFQFNLTGQIPAGAIINSVTLRVVVVKAPGGGPSSIFDLHRVLTAWKESQVTWNSSLPNTPWQVPGAEGPNDSVPTASSSVLVRGTGNYTFPSTQALVADVQAWADNPATNFGWLLASESEAISKTARLFGAHENPANVAKLTVNYTLPTLSITTQPQSQTNFVGNSAAFHVAAAGAPPLTYQWLFGTNPIPGATTDTLTVTGIRTNDAGPYTVVITNSSGSITSQPAILTVSELPPVNIVSPTNGTRFLAGTAVLVSAASSDPNAPISQVEFFLNTNSVGISTNSPFTATLTGEPAGEYALRANTTYTNGITVASSPVSIIFVSPPVVTLTLSALATNLPLGITLTNTAQVTTNGSQVTNVDFLAGATVLGSRSIAPFTNVWMPASNGLYSLTAVAMDDFGLVGTSAPVVIRIHSPETTPPRITITNVSPNSTRVYLPDVRMAGTASDNQGVYYVAYQVNSGPFLMTNGPTLPSKGTSNWLATVRLLPGNNEVLIHSVDFADNSSAVLTRLITYVVTNSITVQTEGQGTVTPNLNGKSLEVGTLYQLNARPASGFVFDRWLGLPQTNRNAALNFILDASLTNLVARFVRSPFVPGTYTGVFFDTNNVLPESSGFLSLQLALSGSFSANVSMNGTRYPFIGQFDLTGQSSAPVLRPALTPVALSLQLDLLGGTGQLTGLATTASGTNVYSSQLFAERNSFNAKTNPAPQAGSHSFLVTQVPEQMLIGGGQAAIATAGTVRIQGQWSNFNTFGLSSTIFQYGFDGGNVPFYLSYFSGTEIIIGLPHFGVDLGDISGELWWVRSGTNGFSHRLELSPPAR